MGNAGMLLPEELQDLVRDAVAEVSTAAGALAREVPRPRPGAAARERRGAPQATILRLPAAPPPPPPSPPAPPATAPPSPAPGTAGTPHGRAFLHRLAVPAAVPAVRYPARTRRVAVPCHRPSPLDARRVTRMLRIAVPTVNLGTPASLVVSAGPPAPPRAAPAPSPPPPRAPAAAPVTAAPPARAPQWLPAASPEPALEERAEPPAPSWRAVGGHVTNLLIAAALGLVATFCAIVVGLVVTGHHLEQVVTGSMQPTIPIGSLVVTERVPVSQLQVGDILVFPNPDNGKQTIVHRIVWLSHDSQGDVLVRTKGDYNALPDNWTVSRPAASDADIVHWIIPGGGTLAAGLQDAGIWGLIALVAGGIGWYGLHKVRQILREDDEPDAEPDAGEAS